MLAGGERQSLANLYRSALEAGAQASRLDARSDEANAITEASLASFRALNGRVDAIGLFSDNEFYDEVATSDAPYLMLPYAYAEVLQRQRATRRLARLRVIADAHAQLKKFTKLVDHLELLPEDEKKLFSKRARGLLAVVGVDAGKKREAKIKQYQKETELKQKVQALRVRRDPSLEGQDPFDSDLSLIASLLPIQKQTRGYVRAGDSDDDDDEDVRRELINMTIRLCWARAHQALGELHTEKDMLEKAPKDPNEDEEKAEYDVRDKQKGKGKAKADGTWKLDGSRAGGPDGKGALLDAEGKPLRPFTITSSRAKLQSEVFRPDHRLPTMTIEEYLAEEQARGNFISGGGAASGEGLTSDEKLTILSEFDGTTAAEEAEIERIKKQEYWSLYTESHRRGAGNTMNRG